MTRDALSTALLDALRMNRSVIVLIAAYVLSAFVLGRLAGFDVSLQIYSASSLILMFVSFCVVLISLVMLQLYRHRPARPTVFLWNYLRNDLRIVERSIIALPCLMLFPAFSSAMTSLKSAIPLMHPYRFDPLFAEIDSLMHGGHAWELIHPLVGFPLATFLLNVAYNLWFFIMWAMFAWATVMTSKLRLREQYLLAFFGCWILIGSLAATALSSVGPCYYGLLHASDPYAPLMSYLRSVDELYPIWALATQDMLWDRYVSSSTGLGSGIAAMPSMHVAIATLNAILLSKLSRTAGVLGWIYVGVILLGSVHLGWHYAIDGYVSIIAVVLIWRAAGWWTARSATPVPAIATPAQLFMAPREPRSAI